MGDNIFDDVDDILNGEFSEEDKSFNESELQDIMSEIEDLEKEFVTDEAPTMSLQEKIEAELMNASVEETNEDSESKTTVVKTIATTALKKDPELQVLPFGKSSTKLPSKNEVAFEARGPMSLNLDFKVGDETAKLCIDPVKGLTVTVAGVELCIDDQTGCTVTMDNGMKFTIPLSNEMKSPKKKAV